MEQIGIRELKSKLSAFLRRVEDGEEFEVTEHGRPVARLTPYSFYPSLNDASPGFLLGEPATEYSAETSMEGHEGTPSPRKKKTPKEEQESYASLLRYAQKKGKHRTQKELLATLVKEYVRKLRQLEIIDLFGKIDYYPDYDYKAERRRK